MGFVKFNFNMEMVDLECFGLWVFTALVGVLIALILVLMKRANEWYYVSKLEQRQKLSLPPGDLGLPFIGNMFSLLISLKFGHPDSFISNYVTRYGRTGIYKAYLFGNPTIIVTSPETCRLVLMDDTRFKSGWPKSTFELIGRKSFLGLSPEEHKRLRRLTSSPISGQKALSVYHEFMKDVIVSSLDELAKTDRPIEFLTEIRNITFKIVMHIFLGIGSGPMIKKMEQEYAKLNCGLRAMAINLPGFAYHRALKGRKNLVKILQDVIDSRRERNEKNRADEKKDMMDLLLDTEDESGKKLDDEEIIDVILMYLNAGYESTAHATLWAILFLHQNPAYLYKAKAEQDDILQRRSRNEQGLSLKEIKQMEYLSKVIDETLRVINVSLFTYREAKSDVNIIGYTIPKGWKVLIWFRGVHLDPQSYKNPKEFNPSRWNGLNPKKGTFMPFGAGNRLCPGSELTKLELSTFLHYFLLYYELEVLNPSCGVRYLPHTKPKDNCLAKLKKSLL